MMVATPERLFRILGGAGLILARLFKGYGIGQLATAGAPFSSGTLPLTLANPLFIDVEPLAPVAGDRVRGLWIARCQEGLLLCLAQSL
jgi:hypothetical protein